jgi:hypothetical protein
MTFKVPNKYRVHTGEYGSDDSYGCNGAFFIPRGPGKAYRDSNAPFKVIASDGEGWEHVSVSLPNRTPTWAEMDSMKRMFWDDDDCVMQLHPPRADWINNHPYCLHLWRPVNITIPQPPGWLVGNRDANIDETVT